MDPEARRTVGSAGGRPRTPGRPFGVVAISRELERRLYFGLTVALAVWALISRLL